MTCPNLSNPTYKKIVETYGKRAAYVSSHLFDSNEFIDWKGDDEIPGLDDEMNISSNLGDIFSLSDHLEEYLHAIKKTVSFGTPLSFNMNDPKSEYYDQLPNGSLVFRKEITPGTNPKIGANDNIIFGHPTIGKTFLKSSDKTKDSFISLDDDYAQEIKDFISEHKKEGEDKYQYQERKPQEFIDYTLQLFDRAKAMAKAQGKKLFTSNNIILDKRASDFDKVINLNKDEFYKRIGERNTTYDVKAWKKQIDDLIAKVDPSKVINTSGYLSDLINPKSTLQLQKPYKLGNVTHKYVMDIAERLKSKFGVDYKIINDGQKFWAGHYENGVATINLAYASEDTPFHEFSHPFIDTLQVTNPKLFDQLADELIRDRTILLRTKSLYPELLGNDLIKEAMVQAIGEYAAEDLQNPGIIRWIKELLKELSDYLGKLFDNRIVLPAELPANLTLRHIGALLNSNLTIPVLTLEGSYLQKIQNTKAKLKNATTEQSTVLNILIKNSKKVLLDEGPHTYEDENGLSLSPVSTVKRSTWTGPSGATIYTDWGTQVDSILSAVIDGLPIPETLKISDKAKEELVKYFTKVVADLTADGSILVTQAVLSDSIAQVAGSTDVIQIKPDGSINIYDLKTSKYYTGKDNVKSQNNYDTLVTGNGLTRSKRQDHAAQLSFYRGLAENMDLKVNDLTIIPVFLFSSAKTVTGIEVEPFIPVTADMKTVNSVLNNRRKSLGGISGTQELYSKYLDKLKVLLQEKINRIKTSLVNKTGVNAQRLAVLEGLSADLVGIHSLKEISKVIDTFHTELVVGTDKIASQLVNFDRLVKTIPDILSTEDPKQIVGAINKLNHYLDYVNDFKQLDEFKAIYAKSVQDKVEVAVDSPLYKLNKIIQARDTIIADYTKAVAPLMARNLSELISPDAQKAAINWLNKREQYFPRIAKAKLENKLGLAAQLEKKVAKIEEEFNRLSTDEDKILMQLTSSTGDMGMFEYLTGTMTNAGDNILGLFAKKMKGVFTKVDQDMVVLQREAAKQLQAFAKATKRDQNNPETFNKGLYEVVTSYKRDEYSGEYNATQTKQFVGKVDQNRYNKALLDRDKKANVISLDKTNVERAKFIAEWYQANHIPLPEAEREKILAEKKAELDRKVITSEAYQIWLKDNMFKNDKTGAITYKRELSQPNPSIYTNSAYDAIQRDPAIKKYYDFLIGLHQESQRKIPMTNSLGLKLPSVSKALEDRIKENGGWKHVGAHIKDFFIKTTRDDDRYNDRKVVPTYFTHFMEADNVSNDLLASMLQFAQSASNYEAVTGGADHLGIEQESIAFVNLLKARDIAKMDSSSMMMMKKAAKDLGISQEIIDKQGGLYAAFAEHFIDQVIYGAGEQKVTLKLGETTYDVGKTVNSLMSAAAFPALGGPFTILKALANKLNAEYSVLLEAFGAEHFNMAAYRKGKAIYNGWMGKGMMKDFESPVSVTKQGQLMDMYSPMQNHFRDHFGKEITWKPGKKMLQPSTWFFFQGAGEHTTINSMFFAMMNHKMVKQNGKDISLYDAYEMNKEGVLQLKEGVEFSDKDRENFIDKIHAINKPLHGIYNKMDKSVAQKHAVGRLLMMYRKFLRPAVIRRWGSVKVDQELGTTVEGFHRTLVRTLMTDWHDLLNFYSGKEGQLTPMEQANLRKATFELVAALTLTAFIGILCGLGDDKLKKDKGVVGYSYNSLLYELYRLRSEILFFIPGIGSKDQLRILTSPSAANGSLNKLAKFVEQLATGPTDTYDKSNAYYLEGESKLKTSAFSLLGVYSADPKRNTEQFK